MLMLIPSSISLLGLFVFVKGLTPKNVYRFRLISGTCFNPVGSSSILEWFVKRLMLFGVDDGYINRE